MDNPQSWYYPFALQLKDKLLGKHEVHLVHQVSDVSEGDVACFLSCEKIIKQEIRDRNKCNIVVHSSALPEGKGWSPLTWQILEGRNAITNTLFEAVDQVDAGRIFLQNEIIFKGHELLDELHKKQGESINDLILKFTDKYPHIVGKDQVGQESFYRKRSHLDSELDPDKTLAEQFNLLRIVDNEKYPAFFKHNGHKYILKIEEDKLKDKYDKQNI